MAEGDKVLTPDDAVNVLEEILEAQTKSYVLGLKLQLPLYVVDAIYETYPRQHDRLLQVIIEFTKQTQPRPTWRAIVTALRCRAVNLPRLASIVEAAHFPNLDRPPVGPCVTTQPPQQISVSAARILADTPTLTEVLRFNTSSGSTINMAQKIGRHYATLGPLLLNDDTGALTLHIVSQQRDVELINEDILRQWLYGQGKQPVSWFTFIAVLKDVGLLELAQEIEGNLIKAKVQEHKRENDKLQQQLKTRTLQLQETKEKAEQFQQAIRQKEIEKDRLAEEIGQAQQKLRKVRQQEHSSRKEIEDLKGQLQSSEALVDDLEKNFQSVLKTKVKGPGLQSATVNHETHIIVELADFSGKPCLVKQRVSAELSSITTSTNPCRMALKVQVTSLSQYMVTYKPLSRGQHGIFIRLNDTDINGSPFTVTVYPDPNKLPTPEIVEGVQTPYSIVFNSDKEMLVSEKLRHKISVFDDKRRKTDKSFGTYGHGSGDMIFPQGMAIDDKGNIYVSSSNKLQKFDSDFQLVAWAEENFNDPYGITLYNNEVYVCDCNNHRIKVYNPDLRFIRAIGSYGKERGKFSTPYDVKFDSAGYMYVADWGNERVQVLDNGGHYIRLLDEEKEGTLCRPSSLHIVDMYVYVSDYNGGCIVVYKTSGEYVTSFGNFMYPYCITSCSDGYIYVCDRENGKIQIF